MKKVWTVALCALLVLTMAACGAKPKEVDLASVRDKIISECGIEAPIMLTNDHLLNLYGIDSADVKQSACCMTMNSVFR